MGYAGVGPYRIPHVRVDALAIYTNLPPNGAFRGYGAMQSVWASERTMDALAEELGMSPLELRRRNLLRDGDVFATGEVMHDVHFEECLDAAAARGRLRGGPARRRPVRPAQGDADAEPGGDPRRAQRRSATSCAARRARWARACARSIRLMAAELLGCEPGQVEVPDPDTDTSPFDTRTTSSRSTHMMGRALAVAVRDLRANGGERGFGEVVNEGGLDPDTGQGDRLHPLAPGRRGRARARRRGDRASSTVERLHGVAYAGRVVDRAGAELQNEGSMIMGLGTALFEELDFADGQVANANLSDYNVPAPGDLPDALHARADRARGRGGARAGRDGAAAGARRDRQRAGTRSASTCASCR